MASQSRDVSRSTGVGSARTGDYGSPTSAFGGVGNAGRAARTGANDNPAEQQDSAGNNTTIQADPSVGEGFNATAPATPTIGFRDPTTIRIKHGKNDPLVFNGCLLESALYEEVPAAGAGQGPAQGAAAPPGAAGIPITGQLGDVDAPIVQQKLADSLFIEGQPKIEDVHQVGFADCYFLASVISMTKQDPGRPKTVVTGTAKNATVNLFRYDTAANTWKPVSMSVDGKLVHNVDSAGNAADLKGAGFRVGALPKRSSWWAEVVSGELRIHRDDEVEGAMWAPLLEKGYAAYAQKYGQYGGYDSGNANGGASGYDRINGGIADYSYPILYGPDAVNFGQTNMSYTPGANNVTPNLAAIQNLLRVMGQGVAAGQAFEMTVGASPNTMMTRLQSQAQYILGTKQVANYPTLRTHLQKLDASITTWSGKSAGTNDEATAKADVVRRAFELCKKGNWPLLHSSQAPREYTELNELANVVANLGTDHSSGQRFTYAWHSYSVLGAHFRGQDGKDMALTQANVAAQAANIDARQSTVDLMNPHGTNEPDEHGLRMGGAQDGNSDGKFSLSLDQFLQIGRAHV